MRATIRPLAAEFLGTFFFVFVGCAAVVLDSARGGMLGLGGITLVHALALAIAISITMPISGGHLNPAVSFGLWVAGRLDLNRLGLYVVAQLAAAVVAALAVKGLYPAGGVAATSIGVPRIAPDVTLTRAILVEAVITGFLVSAVFGTAASRHAPRLGGFAIGLTLIPGILVAGPLTGAAANPARAFGPAMASMDWHGHLAHWIGPLLGSAVVAFIWAKLLLPLPGDPEP